MRKGNVTIIIVLVVIIFLLAGSLFTPILLFGEFRGGQLDKPTGIAYGGGSGCFVSDNAFTDTSAADRADEIVAKIVGKWSNAKGNEEKIRELIIRGQKEGINPLLPLAIWLGEQTFGKPEKAFGYGYTDSGVIKGSTGWENQVNGVYSRLNKVLENSSPYNSPSGANRYTRLFYNYTTAMRIVYQNSGNSWNEEAIYVGEDGKPSKPHKDRMAIFHLLAPNQIECVSSPILLAGASTGSYGCPVDPKVAKSSARGGWGDVISKKDYKIGTYGGHEGYDLMSPVGTKVYSTSGGKVVRISNDLDGDNQSDTSVTVLEKENVYWYYTHIQNIKVVEGQEVKRGQLLAEVGKYIRSGQNIHHLHLGVSKRLNNRATAGDSYNWDAWYYPYIFLKDIPCLLPPSASEVNYNV